MCKRFGAIALAVASLPLVVLSAAGPASAQEGPPPGRPCGNNYTNGQEFAMRTSPTPARGNGRRGETAVRVSRGAEVVLGSRLFLAATDNRAAKVCPGERVGFYARDAGRTEYVLLNSPDPVTDFGGLVQLSKIARVDFRFFSNYNINAVTVGVRTGQTLVQTR